MQRHVFAGGAQRIRDSDAGRQIDCCIGAAVVQQHRRADGVEIIDRRHTAVRLGILFGRKRPHLAAGISAALPHAPRIIGRQIGRCGRIHHSGGDRISYRQRGQGYRCSAAMAPHSDFTRARLWQALS